MHEQNSDRGTTGVPQLLCWVYGAALQLWLAHWNRGICCSPTVTVAVAATTVAVAAAAAVDATTVAASVATAT